MESDKEFFWKIINSRQTIRNFSTDIPEKIDIEWILSVGLLAPYAVIGTHHDKDFRKFYIFEKGTENRSTMEVLIKRKAKNINKVLYNKGSKYLVRMLESIREGRLRDKKYYDEAETLISHHEDFTGYFKNMDKAPYYIIVAEKSRSPRVARSLIRQSLGHCMQNMWLASTVLGLAFQPVSLVDILNSDK